MKVDKEALKMYGTRGAFSLGVIGLALLAVKLFYPSLGPNLWFIWKLVAVVYFFLLGIVVFVIKPYLPWSWPPK